jgi:hypothetical protein
MTFEWVTLLGTGNQFAGNSAVDGAGNVYVAFVDASNNTHVAQLNAGSGTFGWNVAFSGSSASDANGGPYAGLAVGPSGDVYITGRNASAQAFVAKLDASGNVLWNQFLGASGTDGRAVAVDSSENVYVAYDKSNQAYVGKLNSATGSSVWIGSVGSRGSLSAGIAVDSAGNVYVTGGGGLLSNKGFFVEKLAPGANGSLTQSWNEKTSGVTWSTGLAVDLAGNVYTTGSFAGSVDFDPGAGQYLLTAIGGGCDIFVSKLDPNGNFIAAADIVKGDRKSDYGHAIAVDDSSPASPNVYATGGFRGMANFNPTGTYDLTVDGGSTSVFQDVYVSKLTQSSGAGGAAVPSPPNTGRNSAVLLASSPISLPYFGESVNPLQAAGEGAAPQGPVSPPLVPCRSEIVPVRQPQHSDAVNAIPSFRPWPAGERSTAEMRDRLFADFGTELDSGRQILF